jgi:hypothetical protein
MRGRIACHRRISFHPVPTWEATQLWTARTAALTSYALPPPAEHCRRNRDPPAVPRALAREARVANDLGQASGSSRRARQPPRQGLLHTAPAEGLAETASGRVCAEETASLLRPPQCPQPWLPQQPRRQGGPRCAGQLSPPTTQPTGRTALQSLMRSAESSDPKCWCVRLTDRASAAATGPSGHYPTFLRP